MKNSIKIIVLIALIVLADQLFAQGCSQCRLTPAKSINEGENIARGLNNGILYLMAVPYLALMFIFRKQIQTGYKILRARLARH